MQASKRMENNHILYNDQPATVKVRTLREFAQAERLTLCDRRESAGLVVFHVEGCYIHICREYIPKLAMERARKVTKCNTCGGHIDRPTVDDDIVVPENSDIVCF